MSRHLLYIYIATGLGLLAACSPSVPSRYIQPGDMEDLLYDYHIAMAMADEADGSDTLSHDFRQTLYFATVLKKHGVTKAEFDSSLTYYYIRADRFSDIYKNVARRLSEEALELGATEGEVARYTKLNANGDTADVWTGRLSAMLVPYAPYNRYDFVQAADTSFRKGDSFMFIVNNDFVYQSGSHTAQAYVALHYDNDTVVGKALRISTAGIGQLRFPELEGHKVKEIRGFVYLEPETELTTTLKLMAVKSIQLIKFRKQQKTAEAADSLRQDGIERGEIQRLEIPKTKKI